MQKLITFTLLLMLISCNNNQPNIVIPTFENRATTKTEVLAQLGKPDITITINGNAKFIYRCEFIKIDGMYIRVESKERCFIVLFWGDVVIGSRYEYSCNVDVVKLLKN